MANHVHRDAYAVRDYVQRKRVVVTWCSGLSLFPDMWTKAVMHGMIGECAGFYLVDDEGTRVDLRKKNKIK